jgi:hypothetical protein
VESPDVSPGPSASIKKTEEFKYIYIYVYNIKGPDFPEPAAEGNIRIEYSSDYFCSPSIEAVTTYCL